MVKATELRGDGPLKVAFLKKELKQVRLTSEAYEQALQDGHDLAMTALQGKCAKLLERKPGASCSMICETSKYGHKRFDPEYSIMLYTEMSGQFVGKLYSANLGSLGYKKANVETGKCPYTPPPGDKCLFVNAYVEDYKFLVANPELPAKLAQAEEEAATLPALKKAAAEAQSKLEAAQEKQDASKAIKGGVCPGESMHDDHKVNPELHNVAFYTGAFPHLTSKSSGYDDTNFGDAETEGSNEGGNPLHKYFRRVARSVQADTSPSSATVLEVKNDLLGYLRRQIERDAPSCPGKVEFSCQCKEKTLVSSHPYEVGDEFEMDLYDAELQGTDLTPYTKTYKLHPCQLDVGAICDRIAKKNELTDCVAGAATMVMGVYDNEWIKSLEEKQTRRVYINEVTGLPWYPLVAGAGSKPIEEYFPFRGLGCNRGRDSTNAVSPAVKQACGCVGSCSESGGLQNIEFASVLGLRTIGECCAALSPNGGSPSEGYEQTINSAKPIAAHCSGEVPFFGTSMPRWKVLGFKTTAHFTGLTDCWVSHSNGGCEDPKAKMNAQIRLRSQGKARIKYEGGFAKAKAKAEAAKAEAEAEAVDQAMDEKRENGEWTKEELAAEKERLKAKGVASLNEKVRNLKDKGHTAKVEIEWNRVTGQGGKHKYQVVGKLYSNGLGSLGYETANVETGKCPYTPPPGDKCLFVYAYVEDYEFLVAEP